MATDDGITGAEVVARALKELGVIVIFGLTGYPVTAILEQAINAGIRYIGFRNEQAASYAASAYGYLTGKPGCCIVVGGPGVVHAMAGVWRIIFIVTKIDADISYTGHQQLCELLPFAATCWLL